MMLDRKFVVVELPGYVGETEVSDFPTLREAFAFMKEKYDDEDREKLKVDVRQDWTDETGEQHQEYVY